MKALKENEKQRGEALAEDACIIREERCNLPECGACLTYTLVTESGFDRAAFCTVCERVYSIRICLSDAAGRETECVLRDVARTETIASGLFETLLRGRVTPCAAAEIVEELLFTGFY